MVVLLYVLYNFCLQVIENGESKSVTTITQFHTPGKQNLVSKQIERLYGNDPMAQVEIKSRFWLSLSWLM